MTEKPETWLSRGAALPLEAIGPDEHMLTADEVLVEVDACQLWHESLGYAFGATHASAQDHARPHSRIAGHVVEGGENALYFVDRSVAIDGVVPCGQHEPCWTGGAVSCPRQTAGGADGPAPHQVVVRTCELSVLGEREGHTSVVGLDPLKEG